jgi:hypothetical protein
MEKAQKKEVAVAPQGPADMPLLITRHDLLLREGEEKEKEEKRKKKKGCRPRDWNTAVTPRRTQCKRISRTR